MVSSLVIGQGLLVADRDSLALMLATLREMTTLQAIRHKLRSWATRSCDTDLMGEFLRQQTAEMTPFSTDEIRLQLLFDLQNILSLKPGPLTSSQDLWDASEDVANEAVNVLRQQDKSFTGTTLTDLIVHVVDAMLRQVVKKAGEQGSEQQECVIRAIAEHLEKLPEEQQQALREALHADELTGDVLRKALVTGALGTALAATVQTAGFGAYIAAVKALAASAALVGLALPFGAYTALTSTIAVLSNPLVIIPAWLFGARFLMARSDRTIRARLVPLTVTQLAISGLQPSASTGPETVAALVGAHEQLLDGYRALARDLGDVAGQLHEAQSARGVATRQARQLRTTIAQAGAARQSMLGTAAREYWERGPSDLDRLCAAGPLAGEAALVQERIQRKQAVEAAPVESWSDRARQRGRVALEQRACERACKALIERAAALAPEALQSASLPEPTRSLVMQSQQEEQKAVTAACELGSVEQALREAGARIEVCQRRRRSISAQTETIGRLYPGTADRHKLHMETA
jgi:hypothetical protein